MVRFLFLLVALAAVAAPVVFSPHEDKVRDQAAALLESIRSLADGAEVPARAAAAPDASPRRN